MRVNMTGDSLSTILRDGEKSAAADGREAKAETKAEGGGEEPKAEAKAEAKADGEEPKAEKPPWYQRKINEQRAQLSAKDTEIATLRRMLPKEPQKEEAEDEPDKKGMTEAEIEAEAERRAEAKAAEKTALAEWNRACDAAVADGIKRFPDFKETMGKYKEHGGILKLEGDYGYVSQVLITDDPAKVLHALAADPERLTEVLELSPAKRLLELNKIANARAPAKKQSSAPDPIDPVKGGDGALVDPLDKRHDTATWIANRQKDVEAKGNRRLIGAPARASR